MPKLWTDTIQGHRESVSDAILDATARLVDEQGLASLTMSGIAEGAGIGRATLYKYFSDVRGIIAAWHERMIAMHMHTLVHLQAEHSEPFDALLAVLSAYGAMARRADHHGTSAAFLHGLPHTTAAHSHLLGRITTLVAAGAKAGTIRADVPAHELATFALQAIAGAEAAKNAAAVGRIVDMIQRAIRS